MKSDIFAAVPTLLSGSCSSRCTRECCEAARPGGRTLRRAVRAGCAQFSAHALMALPRGMCPPRYGAELVFRTCLARAGALSVVRRPGQLGVPWDVLAASDVIGPTWCRTCFHTCLALAGTLSVLRRPDHLGVLLDVLSARDDALSARDVSGPLWCRACFPHLSCSRVCPRSVVGVASFRRGDWPS